MCRLLDKYMLFCFFVICGLCVVNFAAAQLSPDSFAADVSFWCHIAFAVMFLAVSVGYTMHIDSLIKLNSKHVIKDAVDVAVQYEQMNQRQRMQRTMSRRSIRIKQESMRKT